jgi:signal transduction histidine kinase
VQILREVAATRLAPAMQGVACMQASESGGQPDESTFEELKRYVGFGSADEASLRRVAPFLGRHGRSIAERFQARLEQHEPTRALLRGAEKADRLVAQLVDWLQQLLSGPWDEAYFQRRMRLGRMHVALALPQRYMFVGVNQLREELLAISHEAFPAGPERTLADRAIHRILDLELAVLLEAYSDERTRRIRRLERQRSEHMSAVGTLAAGLAHEIRNPLNSAHLQLSVLQRRLGRRQHGDLEAALQAASVVSSEMDRLAALVSEFLQFARPQPPRTACIDLRATAESVRALVAPDAETSQVEVRLEPGPPVWARADGERLKQALLHLVHNAMEATGVGGHVEVRVGAVEGGVLLAVQDDGPGLRGNDARIFEPFFTTKPDGTGLGLAIVERIVRDHGGRISVSSEPGLTCFELLIPAEAASSANGRRRKTGSGEVAAGVVEDQGAEAAVVAHDGDDGAQEA